MLIHTITLDSIRFDDPTGKGEHLRYPMYRDFFDYGKVGERVRLAIQLEPAFRFACESDDVFDFWLRIEEEQEDFYFAADAAGRPIWRESAGQETPGVTAVELTDRQTCRLRVEPRLWLSGPRSVDLRIFCNRRGEPGGTYRFADGVSLTFIRSGGEALRSGLDEIVLCNEFQIPVDALFLPRPLPRSISLMPVFRPSRQCGALLPTLATTKISCSTSQRV